MARNIRNVELEQSVVQMLASGKKVKEVANHYGIAGSTVYLYAKKNDLDMQSRPGAGNPSQCEPYKDLITSMILAGKSYREIAEKTGICTATVKRFCITRDCRSTATTKRNEESYVAEFIREIDNGFEYISGYKNRNSYIMIRCGKCGEVFDKRYSYIRDSKKIVCPKCELHKRSEEIKKRKAELEQKKRARAEERKRLEDLKRQIKQEQKELEKEKKVHPCSICGEPTSNPKYCSDDCRRKANNRAHDLYKRHKRYHKGADYSISVRSLYKRDNGVCHICGMKCNFDDYVIRGNAFIAGNWYPSVDHIVPLSKGGRHILENVKLAHRICNSICGDREIHTPPGITHQL